MSGISSRRTYDTDSITLRRVFAYDISNNTPFSTGYVLTSLVRGVASFESPYVSLSTIGYLGLPAQISTLSSLLYSTVVSFNELFPSSPSIYLPSTVRGLGTSGYVSTSQFTSTIQGLGTLGYISSFSIESPLKSSIIGLGTAGYISTSALVSTLDGLGTIGYVSSASLQSTFASLNLTGFVSTSQLFSSLRALGSLGYISTSQLASTVSGLGSSGYVSTSQLTSSLSFLNTSFVSTVAGLGSAGYLSSTGFVIRSSFSNNRTSAPNYCNIAYLYSNLRPTSVLSSLSFDLGNSLRGRINSNITKLDIEVEPNLQFVYYDTISRDYQFNTLLVRGTTYNTSEIIASNSYTYYILNASPINLAFFFKPTYRFIITNSTILNALGSNAVSSLSLYHTFGPNVPATNQFFATPTSTACVNVVLDNTPRS